MVGDLLSKYPVYFRATATAPQSVPYDDSVTVNVSAQFDNCECFSGNTFTVPVEGCYVFQGGVGAERSGVGTNWSLEVNIPGNTSGPAGIGRFILDSSTNDSFLYKAFNGSSGALWLQKGDVVTLKFSNPDNTGVTIGSPSTQDQAWFSGFRLN